MKNILKKSIALILCLAMVLSCGAFAFGAESSGDVVYLEVVGPGNEVFLAKTPYPYKAGLNALDILRETDLKLVIDEKKKYVKSINGAEEYFDGIYSGWLYMVNGADDIMLSAAEYALKKNDLVTWYYSDGHAEGSGEAMPPAGEFASSGDIFADMDKVFAESAKSLQETPAGHGSVGGEWRILGLARSGVVLTEGYIEAYYDEVVKYVKACKGEINSRKYSDYSRTVLGLTAAGYDPTNVGGYNILAPLGDYESVLYQGISGPIFALIALDSKDYPMPKAPEGKKQATRQLYVDHILSCQLKDGGFALTGESADPDVTAMALQALAGYQDQQEVISAVVRALSCLSEMQDETGGFSSWGSTNCESVAQTIVALCELGIDIQDSRFVKNEKTLLHSLLAYYLGNGEFAHMGESANGMATEQAFYAMTAVKLAKAGSDSLYTMDDVKLRLDQRPVENQGPGLPGKDPSVNLVPVTKEGKTFGDIEGHANQKAIEALAEREIINGMNETTYAPDAFMTRAQYAAIVVRALGLSPQPVDKFVDISDNSWYAGYVGTAYTYGIVRGVSDTHFQPEWTITRQEAAVMTARPAKLCGFDTSFDETAIRNILAQFMDYPLADSWAKESLAFCYSQDILNQADLEIQPQKHIKRCEIAQMLYEMLNKGELLK